MVAVIAGTWIKRLTVRILLLFFNIFFGGGGKGELGAPVRTPLLCIVNIVIHVRRQLGCSLVQTPANLRAESSVNFVRKSANTGSCNKHGRLHIVCM